MKWLHLAVTGAAVCLSYLLGRQSATPSRRNPVHRKAFVLAITVEFETEEDRDVWLKLWADTAKYVADNEPRTLSYETMIADTNPLKVMVFERYPSKSDLTDIHQVSAKYKEFKAMRSNFKFKTTVTGQSYLETNLGYMG